MLTSVILLFLNIYTSNTTRMLLFRSKETTLLDKATLVTSSFSGTDSFHEENINQVMSLLGDLNASRVLITDGEGRILYDSLSQRRAVGKYALFQEIVLALQGQDVFYSRYEKGSLESHACLPVMLHDDPIGCVYIADTDNEQGAVIQALETNLFRISILIEAILLLFSLFFAVKSSHKMRQILLSMQKAREGEYTHKIPVHGTDEYGVLALDFNRLTDRLQSSEQMQRQFVSDASHELKTPLASIKLLSDSIMQNDMDADTMREFVSDIGNEAERLNRMTQKLLSLSKAEYTRQEHEIVDLSHSIGKVFKMLVPMADSRDIRLTCSMQKDCTVLSVEDDMYQIIFNLVENAIKYNVEKGKVYVNLCRLADDVVLTVEDTGIGIPEESLSHIFERFYRVDKARSRQAGGSGLGLSIVHDLVKRNYGEIHVEAREETGSRFVVQFPYFEVETEVEDL